MPPTKSNSFVFAYIFTEKCPRRRSTPPTENPGSATASNCNFVSSVVPEAFFILGSLLWFPTGLENLEKWEGNFQSGKSPGILLRLEKSGNFTQNTGKIRKNYTGKLKGILEKSGKFVSQ